MCSLCSPLSALSRFVLSLSTILLTTQPDSPPLFSMSTQQTRASSAATKAKSAARPASKAPAVRKSQPSKEKVTSREKSADARRSNSAPNADEQLQAMVTLLKSQRPHIPRKQLEAAALKEIETFQAGRLIMQSVDAEAAEKQRQKSKFILWLK